MEHATIILAGGYENARRPQDLPVRGEFSYGRDHSHPDAFIPNDKTVEVSIKR